MSHNRFLIMKKTNHFKMKKSLPIATLFLTLLNAAEQNAYYEKGALIIPKAPIVTPAPAAIKQTKINTNVDLLVMKLACKKHLDEWSAANQRAQEMDVDIEHKEHIVKALLRIKDDHFTDFKTTIDLLTEGMTSSEKVIIISTVSMLHPDIYKDTVFIDTVNKLSQGMCIDEKAEIIEIVAKAPSNNMIDILEGIYDHSQDIFRYERRFLLSEDDKMRITAAFANVPSNRYPDFITTVNQLSQGMNISKLNLIEAVSLIHPENYAFLQTFIRNNPTYFHYVSILEFAYRATLSMTQEALEELLKGLPNIIKHP
ncbi:MAG: hypothetical protein NEHIOOID_00022 [Holosporales bacterium]